MRWSSQNWSIQNNQNKKVNMYEFANCVFNMVSSTSAITIENTFNNKKETDSNMSHTNKRTDVNAVKWKSFCKSIYVVFK